MPAVWLPIAPKVKEKINTIFIDGIDDAKAARNLYKLSSDSVDDIKKIAEESTDEVQIAVVGGVNNEVGENKPNKITKAAVTAAIAATSYFLIRAVTRGLDRIQANEKARQITEDQEKKDNEEKIIESVDKNIEFVTNSELAVSTRDFTEQQQTKNGIDKYIWEHNESENPRLHHVARDGQEYSWDNPPEDGPPGTQPNCLCRAISKVNGTTARSNANMIFQQGEMPKLTAFEDMFFEYPFVSVDMDKDNDAKVIVNYVGPIDESVNQIIRAIYRLNSISKIELNLSSPGGFTTDGLSLYDFLKQHQAQVTINIGVMASSIASIVAMAGDLITAKFYSSVLIHEVSGCMCGREEDFAQAEKITAVQNAIMADIYNEKTGLPVDQIREIMNNEILLDANSLLKMGFIDKIIDSGKSSSPDSDDQLFNDEETMTAFVTSAKDTAKHTSLLASYCKLDSNRGTINMGTETPKVKTAEELQAQLDVANELVISLQAKMAILETQNVELKAKSLSDGDVDSRVKEALEKEKLQLAARAQIDKDMEGLKAVAGFEDMELKSESADSAMREFLIECGVKDTGQFEGKVLNSIYAFALEKLQTTADGSSVENALNPKKEDGAGTPAKSDTWGNLKPI